METRIHILLGADYVRHPGAALAGELRRTLVDASYVAIGIDADRALASASVEADCVGAVILLGDPPQALMPGWANYLQAVRALYPNSLILAVSSGLAEQTSRDHGAEWADWARRGFGPAVVMVEPVDLRGATAIIRHLVGPPDPATLPLKIRNTLQLGRRVGSPVPASAPDRSAWVVVNPLRGDRPAWLSIEAFHLTRRAHSWRGLPPPAPLREDGPTRFTVVRVEATHAAIDGLYEDSPPIRDNVRIDRQAAETEAEVASLLAASGVDATTLRNVANVGLLGLIVERLGDRAY